MGPDNPWTLAMLMTLGVQVPASLDRTRMLLSGFAGASNPTVSVPEDMSAGPSLAGASGDAITFAQTPVQRTDEDGSCARVGGNQI